MTRKINFFTEFKQENILSPLPISFYKEGICEEKNGLVTFKITGFIVTEKEMFVVFPKGVMKKKDKINNQHFAHILLKTLLKYNRHSIQEQHIFFGESKSRGNLLNIVNWIVDDYKRNGLIQINYKKKEFNGKSKINWGKTIKETTPFIINQRIVYINTINSATLKNKNNEVTAVHYKILELIEEEYGWLLEYKLDYPSPYLNTEFTFDRMKHILKSALRVTFNQKDIQLLKKLLDYVELKTNSNGSNNFTLLYTKYFQFIWENICKHLFEDNSDLQNFLPKPYWSVGIEIKETKQIPDTLTIDSLNNLYIIDAKYFRPYEGITHLPGWKDIVKQLFYAKSIDAADIKNIYNVFVFPSPNGDDKSPLIKHGFASVRGRETDFGKVWSFELNANWALQSYVQNTTGNIKQSLIDQIKTL